MQSYLERYLDGDRIGVWAELVALGPAIRSEPIYAEAQAVAQEMMKRAKHNVQLLVERLGDLNYRFAAPEAAWMPPNAQLQNALDASELRYGPLPLVVRKWYEVVGEVDFVGAHPRLSRHDGMDWGGSEQLQCYSDPMMIVWPGHESDELPSFYLDLADDWDEIARMEAESPPPFGIRLGLSAINKANQSGSGAVQILVPSPGFDAPLLDKDDYWMGTLFVPYLRECFTWGGFPGLGRLAEPDRPRDELRILTEGLAPL
jgi:hypothetical protein